MATALTNLQKVPTPALPQAGEEYARLYQDQLNNVLRLYFNRLESLTSSLVGPRGGKYINNPYASIQRTTDQAFVANTVTQITFDQNDFLSGCLNDGTDGIIVEQAGIYNYQFSVQFKNTDSQEHDAWIWLRINNVDVPGTASQFTIPSKHGAVDGHLIGAANFYVELEANQYVSMYSAADNATISMEHYPVQTSPFAMPAIPSVVATLSFVSSLP